MACRMQTAGQKSHTLEKRNLKQLTIGPHPTNYPQKNHYSLAAGKPEAFLILARCSRVWIDKRRAV